MTPSTIRQRLVLDHFYIPVTSEEIEALSPVTTLFRDSPRSRVVSGKEHWDGIYIPSRTGAYFEIVHSANPSGLGLGFSAVKPQYTDARKIVRELPELAWKRGQRVWENNTPWFDWLSIGGYSSEKPPLLDAWIMHYHFSHRDRFTPPSGTRTVDRFKSIHLSLGRKHVPETRRLLAWLPGTQFWLKTTARLRLPDREGSIFDVCIDLQPGGAPLRFRRVEMQLNEGERLPNKRFGTFSIRRAAGGTVVLTKDYPQG